MGIPDLPADAAVGPAARGNFALLATFAAAIFVSAALLFVVQPMFTKMVLPRLGGAPAVWSVAIVFFQARPARRLRLRPPAHPLCARPRVGRHSPCGDGGRHASRCRWRSPRGWGRPPAVGEAFWLHRAVRGLDRAAVLRALRQRAAAAGLVRAHRATPTPRTPISSMSRAISEAFSRCCPIRSLVEPLVTLGEQTRLWSVGFYLLIALIAGCGVLLWRSADHAPSAAAGGRRGGARRRPGAMPRSGSRSRRCRPGCWSPSPPISRPTSRRCRCCGCCRSRSIS